MGLQKVLPSMFGGHCFRMVCSTIVLILAILSMQTMASPLNLEVSINRVQNGNTVERSAGACVMKGQVCGRRGETDHSCCQGLYCTWDSFLTKTCHKRPPFPPRLRKASSDLDSINRVQNGDTAEKSIPACVEKGHFCGRIGLICCEGLKCKHLQEFTRPGFTRTCQ